ncbi:MAG: MgtC/SapB family protein [Actinomycetota bacterium]|nr:MgtC/SapB family protein [Actinomycetota bacterium]
MPDQLPTLELGELILRVAIAGALGGLIGFEREVSQQQAGFRTHILVSLGAALFTLAGAYGVEAFFDSNSPRIAFDPTRVAAQVVTGIGFLGAGAILRQGVTVRGLTTAAALWVTAAIGTAVGLGYYEGAVITTIATVVSLFGLKLVERAVVPKLARGQARLMIEMGSGLRLSELASVMEQRGAATSSMKLTTEEKGERTLIATVIMPPETKAEELIQEISHIEGVSSVNLMP